MQPSKMQLVVSIAISILLLIPEVTTATDNIPVLNTKIESTDSRQLRLIESKDSRSKSKESKDWSKSKDSKDDSISKGSESKGKGSKGWSEPKYDSKSKGSKSKGKGSKGW